MRTQKIRIFLLAALLCLGFAGCDTAEPPAETILTTDIVETTTIPEETLDIPLTADYGGDTFNILSAGNEAYEDFTVDEESSLVLDNARYKVKMRVENDYNIEIVEDVEKSYSSGNGPGYKAINKQVNSGDCDYDLCLIAGYDVSVLAYNSYLYDLHSVPGIDLSKSWWDQNATDSLTVRGVTFFTTGDITTSDNDTAFVVIFNKTIADNYGIEDPYQLVYNNEWTLEKFSQLAKQVSEDLNQDGTMDKNDRFGLMVYDDSICAIVHAAGSRCCTISEDGNIELTIYNENTLAALEDYFSIAYDTQSAIHYQRVVGSTQEERQMWKEDHALFWPTWMGHVPALREMDSDFGLLPYPKLYTSQEKYSSMMHPYGSQYICVPLVQDDVERTGVITEALAYYGQKITLPAYYDINLVGQSTRDEESEDMLDIIFDSIVYDIGYCYQIGPYNKQLIYMSREYDTNFTSRYESYLPASERMLGIINKYYSAAVDEWKK